MLPGYNTDVQFQGQVYHIQTEDNGVANPSIITLIYRGGAILHRRKSDYGHLIGSANMAEQVRTLMRDQHQQVIKSITEGSLDGGHPAPGAAAAEPVAAGVQTLDQAIIDFLAQI
jgi:hypothetical protein